MNQIHYAATTSRRVAGTLLARALRWWVTGRRLLVTMLAVASVLFFACPVPDNLANPVNPSVVAGEASVLGLGTNRVTIQQASQHAIIHWGQFNIAPNEITSFLQPVGGIALNRISGGPSFINGALNATGTVFLLNPNGVLFGANAQVNVGGLVASTLHMTDADFLAGIYRFGGPPTHLGLGDTAQNGMVRNEGQIATGPFGAYLFAHNVENAGIIRSEGGHVALAGGASAYLTNRPDGRGLFVEVSAPTGQATNLKDLVADGGQVSLFGKVVNQSGLIQANSVKAKNGRVELIASEAVTLADGSRILAKGDATGVSNGGTVIAKTDLANGRTDFQKSALIDVSGGAQGGNGGFIELSGSKVTWEGAFRAHAIAGYRGGKLLIDPVFTDSSSITTGTLSNLTDQITTSGLNDIEFQSAGDMTVAARFDLSAWLLPQGQSGTLTFNAGRNLLFNNASLTNGERGQGVAGSRWDYQLLANEHIEIRGSVLSTGSGGSITIEAGRSPSAFGDIRLTQLNTSLTGQPVVETFSGGDISVTTDRDLIAPSGLVGGMLTGIRLNQQGNLTLNVGRDFLGGLAGSSKVGPGFLLGNGKATINVGTNVGAGPDQHPTGGHVGSSDANANATVGGGKIDEGTGQLTEAYKTEIDVRAPGHIYWGLVQDRGLVEDVFGTGDFYVTSHPDSSVLLRSMTGDIFLKPDLPNSAGGINAARKIYPATFDAQALNGSIKIESGLSFFPSLTGRLNFFAKHDLAGVTRIVGFRKDPTFKLVFVGDTLTTGRWRLLDLRTASKDPVLAQYITREPPVGANQTKPLESSFTAEQWPEIPNFSGAPGITLRQGDLKNLQGVFTGDFSGNEGAPQGVDPAHAVQAVNFTSESGSIYSLFLNLLSPVYKKQVTVQAGKDIGTIVSPSGERTGGEFTLVTSLPEGVTSVVSAAGNIGFRKACPTCFETGLEFFGKGTAKLRVGSLDSEGNLVAGSGTLDLGDGRGVQHRSHTISDVNAPGLLEIAAGKDLLMTQSRIISHNGANIWIHGLGAKPALDGFGGPNTQLVRGEIAAGSNRLLVDGREVKVDGVPVVLNGAQQLIDQAVVLDRPGERINGKSFAPVLAKGKPILIGDQIVLLVDGQIQLAKADLVTIEQATGGTLSVGTFASGQTSGILTIRGGNIDIKTSGNVDVFKSRIATLTGGDIAIHSVRGDINAGSGGRNEAIEFHIEQFDENGKRLDPLKFLVPGSGIFTHHGSDPKFPLNFPKFDSPEITALKGEIVKQGFLGRNTRALEEQLAEMVAAREPVFRQVFEQFITENPDKPEIVNGIPTGRLLPVELGDINLRAGRDLVVPSAGIRGRRIRIFAGRNLDLQGGTIEGEVQFDVEGGIKGSLSSFVGAFSGTAAIGGSVSGGASAGGSSLGGGLAGVTGTVSATASATSGTSVTASKTVESVQEKTAESSTQQARAAAEKQLVASKDDKDGRSKSLQATKMKRGVVIQVDVKPQAQPGS
jgi:filamentous hemagglutinin family protein